MGNLTYMWKYESICLDKVPEMKPTFEGHEVRYQDITYYIIC